MQIKLTPAIYQPITDCVICGSHLEPDIQIAMVYTTEGAELGLICAHCRESEPATLHKQILHRADTLRQQATTLEYLLN